uniref:hypothetical protein n=1 Tax=Sphingomonas populi TaxID=2484750 RepID=UPI0013EE8BE6|nr:hypothetical protein [Sphingomonas populi]
MVLIHLNAGPVQRTLKIASPEIGVRDIFVTDATHQASRIAMTGGNVVQAGPGSITTVIAAVVRPPRHR